MLENLPTLKRGIGRSPDRGGCLVQIANWLCDHQLWTDQPVHVHPILRRLGVTVNDAVDDVWRRELALAAVRIAGTREDTPEITARLQEAACGLFGGALFQVRREPCRFGCCAAAPLDPPVVDLASHGDVWEALSDEVKVNDFFKLIDVYDEVTGHRPRDVPESEWAVLAMAMRPKVSLVKPRKTVWHSGGPMWVQLHTAFDEFGEAVGKVTAGMLQTNVIISGNYTVTKLEPAKPKVSNTLYTAAEFKELAGWTAIGSVAEPLKLCKV